MATHPATRRVESFPSEFHHLLDIASLSDEPICIDFASRKQAEKFRAENYQFWHALRRARHPLAHRTQYVRLRLKETDNSWTIRIEPRPTARFCAEAINRALAEKLANYKPSENLTPLQRVYIKWLVGSEQS